MYESCWIVVWFVLHAFFMPGLIKKCVSLYLETYMENIELNQYNKRAWSTCIRTTLNSNFMLNIEQFRQGLADQLYQRIHNTLLDDNIKMGTANKLRTYREHTLN